MKNKSARERARTDLDSSVGRRVYVILIPNHGLPFGDLKLWPLQDSDCLLLSARLVGHDSVGIWLEPTDWAETVDAGKVPLESLGHILVRWDRVLSISSPPAQGLGADAAPCGLRLRRSPEDDRGPAA